MGQGSSQEKTKTVANFEVNNAEASGSLKMEETGHATVAVAATTAESAGRVIKIVGSNGDSMRKSRNLLSPPWEDNSE